MEYSLFTDPQFNDDIGILSTTASIIDEQEAI